jgi:hypothetical protein
MKRAVKRKTQDARQHTSSTPNIADDIRLQPPSTHCGPKWKGGKRASGGSRGKTVSKNDKNRHKIKNQYEDKYIIQKRATLVFIHNNF